MTYYLNLSLLSKDKQQSLRSWPGILPRLPVPDAATELLGYLLSCPSAAVATCPHGTCLDSCLEGPEATRWQAGGIKMLVSCFLEERLFRAFAVELFPQTSSGLVTAVGNCQLRGAGETSSIQKYISYLPKRTGCIATGAGEFICATQCGKKNYYAVSPHGLLDWLGEGRMMRLQLQPGVEWYTNAFSQAENERTQLWMFVVTRPRYSKTCELSKSCYCDISKRWVCEDMDGKEYIYVCCYSIKASVHEAYARMCRHWGNSHSKFSWHLIKDNKIKISAQTQVKKG